MTYDVILIAELQDQLYPTRLLGVQRLATELRSKGYSVAVIQFFFSWLRDPEKLKEYFNTLIGSNTVLIGISVVFDHPLPNSTSVKSKNQILMPTESTAESDSQKIYNAFLDFNRYIRKKFPHVSWAIGSSDPLSSLNEYKEYIDYVLVGLADTKIVKLVDYLKGTGTLFFDQFNGNVKILSSDPTERSFNFPASTTLFLPEDQIHHGEVLPMETSRGCLFKCDFCSYPLLGRKKGDPDYHKTVESMATEFRHHYDNFGISKYMFVDDTFNETTQKIENILKARDLAGVDINFSAYIRLDLLKRFPEQVQLLLDLGIQSASFGIESLYGPSAASIGKTSHTEQVKEFLYHVADKWRGKATTQGLFIIGLPYENPDTLETWIPWVEDPQCPIDNPRFQTLNLNTNYTFKSSLSANPEKYGYTITDNTWSNQYWSRTQADEYTNRLTIRMKNLHRQRIGGWPVLGLQTLGFSIKDLYNTETSQFRGFHELDFGKIKKLKNQKISEYITKMIKSSQDK